MASSRYKTFVGIDANAIVHRAFHAYPETLVTTDGVQVNAVYGFVSMLLSILNEYKPEYIACAFDTHKPTFRHEKYPEYKAHRKPTDHSLIAQFPLVERVLEALNIPIMKREGFEADDILGSLAAQISTGKWMDYGLKLMIFTGDKDLLQLVDRNVNVVIPQGSFKTLMAFNREGTYKRYGFYPEQVVDYKAVVGDPSDNIPGVKGMGDKGVKQLLEKYGSLDMIYQNLAQLPKRQQQLLGEGIEQAEMSRDLATISRDVDLNIQLEDTLLRDYDKQLVLEIFREFEFRSLVTKLPDSSRVQAVAEGDQIGLFAPTADGEAVESIEVVEVAALSDIPEGRFELVMYLDSSSSESEISRVVVLQNDVVYGLDLDSAEKDSFTGRVERETLLFGMESYMNSEKPDVSLIAGRDVSVMYHIYSSGKGKGGLSEMVYDLAGIVVDEKIPKSKFGDVAKILLQVGNQLIGELAKVESTDVVTGIAQEKSALSFVDDVDMPLLEVVAGMERVGVALDKDWLNAVSVDLVEAIAKLQADIYHDLGHEFNISSPKQLAEVLYDEIGLTAGRGKSGRSTREEILKKHLDAHPMIPKILEFRELSKVLGTYVKPFIEIASAQEGDYPRVHSDFHLTGTSSGRISSTDPNMQNLPLGNEWAKRFREAIVPSAGKTFVALDYSQIEFRVIAHMSGDEKLIQDFKNGLDIHMQTATRLFDKPAADISTAERRFAKTVNFGILYGQSKYGLAAMLGISNFEADDYIARYFENYPGIKNYIVNAENEAAKNGYVASFSGRRRYISGLDSSNRRVRDASLREAINMPIQGGAADIMRIAMLLCHRHIVANYAESATLLLQIHDELIFEVDSLLADKFAGEIRKVMETAVDLKVPLESSMSIGEDLDKLK